jgi:predicted DNA-binding ArsR family transcriptional regulator
MWVSITPHIPKNARFTIGSRIENKLLDLLETSYATYFSIKEEKEKNISQCIFILDIIKFLISTSWEAKQITNKHYENMAVKLDELGRIL